MKMIKKESLKESEEILEVSDDLKFLFHKVLESENKLNVLKNLLESQYYEVGISLFKNLLDKNKINKKKIKDKIDSVKLDIKNLESKLDKNKEDLVLKEIKSKFEEYDRLVLKLKELEISLETETLAIMKDFLLEDFLKNKNFK